VLVSLFALFAVLVARSRFAPDAVRELAAIAKIGKLGAYKHEGFWQCMDSIRDKKLLEQMWKDGNTPWKTWER
jgi:NDP-sugar pyrophosphorylase family protein